MIKVCICGNNYNTKPSHFDRRKYCSRDCMHKYRPKYNGRGRKIIFSGRHPRWDELKKMPPEEHYNWKGDKVGYRGIHQWINKINPRTGRCQKCNEIKKTHWANLSGEYKRDINDWTELCPLCHKAFDHPNKGIIKRRFA